MWCGRQRHPIGPPLAAPASQTSHSLARAAVSSMPARSARRHGLTVCQMFVKEAPYSHIRVTCFRGVHGNYVSGMWRAFHDVEGGVDPEPSHTNVIDNGGAHKFFACSHQKESGRKSDEYRIG